MDSQGRKIHAQAEQAREDGKFEESLKFYDQALIQYAKENDDLGFAEILATRTLTLRHLFQTTNNKNFLIAAKHAAMASVEVAEKSGDKKALAIPYFNLAKALQEAEEYEEAVSYYKKAVENMESNPPETHNRPAVLLDFKIHLAGCEYQAGDKDALPRIEEAIARLEAVDEISKYNKDVWISGAHMRIALILKDDDVQKARKHLQKAKEVIDANPDLKLRLDQWQKLAATFK